MDGLWILVYDVSGRLPFAKIPNKLAFIVDKN